MVGSQILLDNDELSVRIHDAPARGWRILFVEKDGLITRYTCRDHALAGIGIYDRSDKTVPLEMEFEVYREAARTGKALGECGLASLVRFGGPDHYLHAAFTLPEAFIKQSTLKIIGDRGTESIYSAGWE